MARQATRQLDLAHGAESLRLQGKTGKAVQDLYTPEIAASKSGYNTLDPMSIMTYDATHTNVRCAHVSLVPCFPACRDMKPSIMLGAVLRRF